MKFHENLRFLMDARGIQIKELAAKTGISENTIKTYLRSASAEPKLSKAIALAKALETTVENLCDENSKNSYENIYFDSFFSGLSANDKKSVLALMKEMSKHY
ncbi:helix-turn-helix transcriptional regulator [Treponema sp. UBA3813]|uniref:helix-turn-helix domain-containing protein n=1 Tax=Treponema sp. UBA3813 TaxID=1947715 RepID=UPI0025EB2A74|nr:helix-turn-helix transcriptional regulator [Treponema sp. UBA3813]